MFMMAAVIASPPDALEEIRKYKFSEPRWNLPGRKGVATAEDRFTIAFSRAYSASFQKIHHGTNQTELALAREIPVNGFGIADLLAISWVRSQATFDTLENFLEEGSFRTRAFECKLTDWRRAMSQASRYRYFAHQSVVVLPEHICQRALPFIETFKKIRVGLWGFDPDRNRINPYHTARPTTPKSERYYMHSIRLLNEATRRALPIR
ncbi:MAG: hypothetical protein ACP5I4_17185 [Oceanipulchritudo sp.]